MAKIRVYELARDLGIESKVLLAMAKTAGITEAKSHQSTLSDESVERLRKIHSGEAGAAAPTLKKAGAVATRPQTIIRRRRKSEESEESEAQQAEGEESKSAASAPAAPERTVATTLLRRKTEGDDQGRSPSSQSALAAAEALFKKRPAEETPPPPSEAKEEPQQEVAASAEPAAPEPAQPAEVAKAPETVEAKAPAQEAPAPQPPEPPRRRRVEGGATIVRRATPEEVKELQQRQRHTGRQEDARGTRITGMGLLGNRVGHDMPSFYEEPQGDIATRARNRGVSVEQQRRYEEEEREKATRTAKMRRANASATMRALLEQAAELSQDEETEDFTPVEFRGRTVYTPTSSARKRDLKRRKDLKKPQITVPKAEKRIVRMGETITVGELAKQLSVKAPEIIKKLMANGVMATINQALDVDTATLIASEYGYEVKSTVVTAEDILKRPEAAPEDLEPRAPIVTVMGHVDHGKTSILDAIRETNVAAGEAGGITQHIGAYSVVKDGRAITFLDTPGHEAFSAMRARGAKVTDIVVLVVAADDGVMPQTVEAINHAKDAGVPVIVAVNKIDKPNINLDRVYAELAEHGIQSEEWGGDNQFVKCSALERRGIDELLEAILLQADILELKASHKGLAEGVVIEAHLDKGRGPVATVVVQQGTLRQGDFLVAGFEVGRVRAMYNHRGQELTEAGPSTPVEVLGLSGVPMAGDKVNATADEKVAREAAEWRREQMQRQAASRSSAQSLEDLLSRVKSEDVPEVPIIVKADTQGSVEAVSEAILKLSTEKVKNRIVHSAVGGVSESDVMLAAASGAMIVAFNVRAARGLDEFAERQGVPIRYFSIIYDIVDAVKAIMVGKLPPVVNEVVLGRAEVRKPISVPKVGTIAGSAVTDGKITRNSHCRLIRDDIVVFEGKLSSLKRFKDDVKEVASGYECGIGIEGYNDIKEGDVIEAFILEETAATL